MSIIVKGIEMPKICCECRFLQESIWRGKMYPCVCVAGGFVVKPSETDLKDGLCPLVELSEKHGRLIDADALADDLEYDAQHFDDDHELKFNAAMWIRSNQNKVIVEAEGEG